MKATVSRKEFIQSLSLGSSFSGKNKALTALDYVKLVFGIGSYKIASNDGEIAINTFYRGGMGNEVEMTVYIEPKLLLNALKSIREDEVTLEFTERECIIKHNKGKFNIPLGDVDEFPTPKMDDNSTNIFVESNILFNWLKEAKNFVANDELRPIMNGVYLYVRNNEIGVCASDGHKLYTDHMNWEDNEEVDAVLSDKAISTLLDVINGTNITKIYFGERNIAFKAGDTSILCRKIEGRYPNFKSVIPVTHTIECECNKNEFLDSLSRCLIMANATSLIKMSIDGMNCKLEAEDFDFSKKSEENLMLSYSEAGTDITIGFKGVFAKLCFDAIESENVKMEMTDHSRAIVFKDENKENKVILLMPMQIS